MQMPDIRPEDRVWVEAVDRYVKGARGRRRRRREGAHGRYILASAVVLALLVSPFAVARTGDVIQEGVRNPSSGSAHRETQIIASNKTYGTRQSNIKNGDGGGAIYGCRTKLGREPCVRASNLKSGRAFEFATRGTEGGFIQADADGARPFSTNATGVATGLNADRVDNLHAARIDFRAATGTATTDIMNFAGLILRASCNAGPDLIVLADTAVAHSTLHVSWNKDPGNTAFYRQDNDLNPGDNFNLLSVNDDSSEGTISYSSPAGTQASVTFQAEEGNAFGNTVSCLFAGTAMGGP
jgi:hypothetical protein